MRIAMVHWGYPPVIGGVETHLAQLCPWLVAAGHQVSVLTGAHPDAPSDYVEKGVHIMRRRVMDLNFLASRDLKELEEEIVRHLTAFFDAARPEVVHAHNMHYFSEIHARVLEREASRRRIPLILTAHNMWDDMLCLSLTRDIRWDHFVAISEYIHMEILGCGVEPERITMIHHGIDGTAFTTATPAAAHARYPLLRGRRVIFHPARMSLAKGSSVVIKAFRLVREEVPGAHLVLTGTENVIDWGQVQQAEVAYMQSLIVTFGMQKDVLVDFFPHSFVPTMYAAADICVYPSVHAEPFGLVMLESMAAGKPIIVTESGGMPEIITEGENGYVIEPRNHIALAERIIHLLQSPRKARQIGSRGRALFQAHYRLEHMARRLLSLYARAAVAKPHKFPPAIPQAGYGLRKA